MSQPVFPPRVLLTTDAVGGVWRYSIELAEAFATAGATVELAILGPTSNGLDLPQARHPGVTLHHTGLPLEWLGTAEEVRLARDILRRLAHDLACTSVQLHSPALVGGGEWPCHVIAMAHSCVGTWWRAVRPQEPMPADLAWRADMVAEGLSKADAVVSPSWAFAAALQDAYGPLPRLTVIRNGRSNEGVIPRPHHAHGIVTAGRLWDEAKNAALLDRVARDTRLTIIAAGPLRAPGGAESRFAALSPAGSLNEPAMRHFLASAGIFVSAAIYEPFGLTVLEAAQAGLALVLSDIPTFHELWEGCALFLPAQDPAAWSAVLTALCANTERCAALGEAARQRAATYGSPAQVAATWRLHHGCAVKPSDLESAA